MRSQTLCTLVCWLSLVALGGLPFAAMAPPVPKKSDADLIREGPAARAAAHGEKPQIPRPS